MKFIVSVDENWGIGKDNELLMRIPEDMKQFRQKTIDNIIIMGRKTLESFPGAKPLPKRINVVLTSNKNYSPENVTVCHTIDEIIEYVSQFKDKDIFVIGGESIYRQFMPYCNEGYITKISKTFDADTFLENLDQNSDWYIDEVQMEGYFEGVKYSVLKYKRK